MYTDVRVQRVGNIGDGHIVPYVGMPQLNLIVR